jgi:hypothetical protein
MIYYYVNDKKLVGRREDRYSFPYLYTDGVWKPDKEHIIDDRLIGFDESEPPDSSYRIGCSDMLERIEEITEVEAMKLIAESQAS